MADTSPADAPAGAPTHAAATGPETDPICPLCDYSLRGLVEPRCPECGYRFTWEELNSPQRRVHPYLFEHHAERNLWSFGRTLRGGLAPATFWRTLFPTQPSRPRRLALYWLIIAATWTLILALQTARAIVLVDRLQLESQKSIVARFPRFPPAARTGIIAKHGSPQAYAAAVSPRFPHRSLYLQTLRSPMLQVTLFAMTIWLAWPWLTLAGLMIFQASMRPRPSDSRPALRRLHQ